MTKFVFIVLVLTFMAASWLCSPAAASDEVLTTYYPAPYGAYRQLVAQTLGVGDNNNDGVLNSNDAPDPATSPGDVWIKGQVGIGTTAPPVAGSAKLELNNTLRLTPFLQNSDPTFPSTPPEGTLYYNNYNNAGKFRYSDGTGWNDIGGAELGVEQQKDLYVRGYNRVITVSCDDGYIATKIIIYTDNSCPSGCDGKCHEAGEIQRIGLVCRKLQ